MSERPDVTQPLDEFLTDYNENDNIWWAMSCGHHMNLFDAAIERIDELTGEREMLWGKVAEAHRKIDDANKTIRALIGDRAEQRRLLEQARRIAIEAGAFQPIPIVECSDDDGGHEFSDMCARCGVDAHEYFNRAES